MTEKEGTKGRYTIQIEVSEYVYRALCGSAAALGISVPQMVCEVLANWSGHTISKKEAK